MHYAREITRLTVLLILGTVLLSGPLVSAVDFTMVSSNDTPVAHQSAADVEILRPPTGEFTITSGRFGAGVFLTGPSIAVQVVSVTGSPRLVYQLSIPDLGRSVVTVAFIEERHSGQVVEIDLGRSAVHSESGWESQYPGRLSVWVQTGNETRRVFDRNVSIDVVGVRNGA